MVMPASLKVKAVEKYGKVREIAGLFGGADKLKQAVEQLQSLGSIGTAMLMYL